MLRPLLLLVDGHSSHYDPDSIQFAQNQSIIIFCLPPHTTHEAQPLDVSFLGPLKKNWSHVCHDFIQSSSGKVITKYNFSELFSKAWLRTCLPEIICSGFKRAGIIPFNPDALMRRCPGSEGSVELRRKIPLPTSCNAENDQTNTQNVAMDVQTEGGQPSAENVAKDSQQTTVESVTTSRQSDPFRYVAESSATTNSPSFSAEKEQLFSQRFIEGYDLHDEEYFSWLRVNHPDALPNNQSSFMDFFPDAQQLIPISSESV